MNRRRILLIFYYCIFALIFTGTVGYVVANIIGLDIPAFEIATVSALLGGFILAHGFINTSAQGQGVSLRRIGLIYLISAISFILFELFSPLFNAADPGQVGYCIVIALVVLLLSIAMLSFSVATAWIIVILPRLW